MNGKTKNLKGFTFIELMVSVFIVAIMSSLFMVNYKSANKRSELGIIKQRLVSDIRKAQNYSQGSKTYDGVNIPGGGWGVHFSLDDPAHYIIFADKATAGLPNGNQIYNIGEAIETKILPSGVTINSLSPSNTVDIVFFPPDPTTFINGLSNINAEIVLKESSNNSTARVSVNFFGLIDAN